MDGRAVGSRQPGTSGGSKPGTRGGDLPSVVRAAPYEYGLRPVRNYLVSRITGWGEPKADNDRRHGYDQTSDAAGKGVRARRADGGSGIDERAGLVPSRRQRARSSRGRRGLQWPGGPKPRASASGPWSSGYLGSPGWAGD